MFFMPMLIGAALGGGISALRGGDPLKGALLGAAGGGLGAATGLLGGAAGGAAGSAGAGIAAQPALSYAGSQLAGAASPGIMSSIGSGIGAASTWMNQNPMLTQMGLGVAQQMLTPEQLQYAPAGQLSRGQMSPMQMANMPTQPFMPQRVSLI